MTPLCDIPSGCCFFTGPWTVTRSSLRMLRRVVAFCRPLRPVLLLVLFPHSRSPVVGVLGLCWMWQYAPFACQRRPVVGVLGFCWLLWGSFDCFCCPHTSVLSPSTTCLSVPRAQANFRDPQKAVDTWDAGAMQRMKDTHFVHSASPCKRTPLATNTRGDLQQNTGGETWRTAKSREITAFKNTSTLVHLEYCCGQTHEVSQTHSGRLLGTCSDDTQSQKNGRHTFASKVFRSPVAKWSCTVQFGGASAMHNQLRTHGCRTRTRKTASLTTNHAYLRLYRRRAPHHPTQARSDSHTESRGQRKRSLSSGTRACTQTSFCTCDSRSATAKASSFWAISCICGWRSGTERSSWRSALKVLSTDIGGGAPNGRPGGVGIQQGSNT